MSAELNTISLSTRGQNQTGDRVGLVGSARRADRVVTFGEVARECRETSRDTTGAKIVGLEHLDPEDLELKRFDEGGDNTFTKSFKKGQMLFGRRRAYLKKAALAPFDGICSGDITVIEAIPEKLDPSLLPFLVQNDAFFSYAVGGSAGSLSPRVKWEHLAAYTFSLPQLAEQKKLAEELWAMERVKRAYKKLLAETDRLVEARFVEMFGDPVKNDKGMPIEKISNISSLVTKGASPTWQGFSYTDDITQTLFVTSENVLERFLDLSVPKYVVDGFNEKQKRSMLKKGDFLINIVGASIGRAAQFNLDCKANINQAVALVRFDASKICDEYALWYLNSPKALQMYDNMKSSVARANLSLGDISNMDMILPPLSLQREFAAFVGRAEKAKESLKNALASLTAAQKARMNAAFRGEM